MAQQTNPQTPPAGSGGQAPNAAAPADLRYAAELIKAVGGDIAQLAQIQNDELEQIDRLAKQLNYVREVMDYGLFVTPEQAEREEDLYPFSIWLKNQFNQVVQTIVTQTQNIPAPAAGGLSVDEVETLLAKEISRLEEIMTLATGRLEKSLAASVSELASAAKQNTGLDELRRQLSLSSESADGKLSEVLEHLSRLEKRQAEQLELLTAQTTLLNEQKNLSPYDDFDVQVEELRMFVKEQTSRWRLYENVFYGVVILMLFINMFMSVWLAVTG